MLGELTLKRAVDEYKDLYLAYWNYAQRTRVDSTPHFSLRISIWNSFSRNKVGGRRVRVMTKVAVFDEAGSTWRRPAS